MSTVTSGYLLIADITGYTVFLSESELDHAQEILSTLLGLLVDHTKPPLQLSRLAGDAVISYAIHGSLGRGETFVEMLENSYVAFRKTINLMVMNNTCHCNACANVANLDLKFFVHYGQFAIQRISDHDELVGSDVNLIHRLLKNHVSEHTGFRAYTLYTDAAIKEMDLEDACATMTPMSESYDHLGEVQIWVQDMAPVWQSKRDQLTVPFPREQIGISVYADIEMAQEQVWDYLATPEHRAVLTGADRMTVKERKNGRMAAGSEFQCYHGTELTINTILEWEYSADSWEHPGVLTRLGRVPPHFCVILLEWSPFERVLTRDVVKVPFGTVFILSEFRLDPVVGGTRLTQSHARPTGPLLPRAMAYLFLRLVLARQFQRDIDAFKQYLEQDLAARLRQPASESPAGLSAVQPLGQG